MAMDIFAYATELKKEKESFYRQLSEQASNSGIGELFGLLADDEARHREAIEAMEETMNVKLAATRIKKDAKKVFQKMKADLARGEPAFASTRTSPPIPRGSPTSRSCLPTTVAKWAPISAPSCARPT